MDGTAGGAVYPSLYALLDSCMGFVGIPLAWGIIETVLNALKLFQKV